LSIKTAFFKKPPSGNKFKENITVDTLQYTMQKLQETDTQLVFPHTVVLKASAGSGKTHALTKRFVQFILSGRVAHNELRNILAVTFSNNAAREMKERVLLWLKGIAIGLPAVIEELGDAVSLDAEVLEKKADTLVGYILTNYSDFQIKTIDSFMASVFKASALDLGVSPAFELLMDNGGLMRYAFDLFLRRVRDDSPEGRLMARLVNGIEGGQGGDAAFMWEPSAAVLEMMRGVHSKVSASAKGVLARDLSKDAEVVKNAVRREISIIEELIESSGLKRNARSGYVSISSDVRSGRFADIIERGFKIPPVSKPAGGKKSDHSAESALTQGAESPLMRGGGSALTQRGGSAFTQEVALPAASGEPPYEAVIAGWERLRALIGRYAVLHARSYWYPYLTAYEVFRGVLERAKKQQGKVFIEDINSMLASYLDGSLVPDVYIRLGETIFHYLIDEFQDTSPVQWKNLHPLIENSLSQGGSLFVVGDTKQAIYGFREADYGIMKSFEAGGRPFASAKHDVRELNVNYRSFRRILEFNETVFKERVASDETLAPAARLSGLTDYNQSVRPPIDDDGGKGGSNDGGKGGGDDGGKGGQKNPVGYVEVVFMGGAALTHVVAPPLTPGVAPPLTHVVEPPLTHVVAPPTASCGDTTASCGNATASCGNATASCGGAATPSNSGSALTHVVALPPPSNSGAATPSNSGAATASVDAATPSNDAAADDPPEKVKLQETVVELLKRGYRPADIAVLALRNEDVVRVAQWLSRRDIPFISYSSLDIRRMKITAEIVSLLNFLDSPVDDLAFAGFCLGGVFGQAAHATIKVMTEESQAEADDLPRQCRLHAFFLENRAERPLYKAFSERYPDLWKEFFEGLFKSAGYLPLYDLVTEVFRVFKVFDNFSDQEAVLIKILEVIKDFEDSGSNDLRGFLDYALEEPSGGYEWNVNVPRGIDAVSVMSVHKAKGLGFPVVIALLYGQRDRGFTYVVEDKNPFGVNLLKLNRKIVAASLLTGDDTLSVMYEEERTRDMVNRLNTLYVGFTRARAEMYVLCVANKPGDFPLKIMPDDRFAPSEKPAEVYSQTAGCAEMKNKKTCALVHRMSRPMNPAPSRRSPNVEERLRGEFIHRVLSFVEFVGPDIEEFLTGVIGRVNAETGFFLKYPVEEVRGMLMRFLSDEKISRYFSPARGRSILKEQEFSDARGNLYRMDRVIVDDRWVTVLDFKTGKGGAHDAADEGVRPPASMPPPRINGDDDRYAAQVRRYLKILQGVYHGKTVRGVIAYVDAVAVVEVDASQIYASHIYIDKNSEFRLS
jgi:ATP-dependent exoDNAse (exonuclease V) beta subunit